MKNHIKKERQKTDYYKTICRMHETYMQLLTDSLDEMIYEAYNASSNFTRICSLDQKKYLFPCPHWFVKQYMTEKCMTKWLECIDPQTDTYAIRNCKLIQFKICSNTDNESQPELSCENWDTTITVMIDKEDIDAYADKMEQELYGMLIAKNESAIYRYNIPYNASTKTLTYKGVRFTCNISPFTKRILSFHKTPDA